MQGPLSRVLHPVMGAELDRSPPALMTPGPALPVATGGEGEGKGHHTCIYTISWQTSGLTLGAGSLASPPPGPAPLCCPGEVQDLLFQAAAGEGQD